MLACRKHDMVDERDTDVTQIAIHMMGKIDVPHAWFANAARMIVKGKYKLSAGSRRFGQNYPYINDAAVALAAEAADKDNVSRTIKTDEQRVFDALVDKIAPRILATLFNVVILDEVSSRIGIRRLSHRTMMAAKTSAIERMGPGDIFSQVCARERTVAPIKIRPMAMTLPPYHELSIPGK